MVRARLRALERKLVLERADHRVEFRVGELVREWESAVQEGGPTPEPLDFIGRIIDEGIFLPTFSSVINYLEDCRYGDTVPAEKALFGRLLPWSRYPVCE